MKNSICILGLATNFTKDIAYKLSTQLDMFYADVNELLQYDLLDIKQAQKKAGKDYIQKLESGKVKAVSTYENTVYTISFSTLNTNNNYEYVQNNSVVLYLKLSEKLFLEALKQDKLTKNQQLMNTSVFKDRDSICKKIAHITITLRSLNEKTILKNIIKELQKFYDSII